MFIVVLALHRAGCFTHDTPRMIPELSCLNSEHAHIYLGEMCTRLAARLLKVNCDSSSIAYIVGIKYTKG